MGRARNPGRETKARTLDMTLGLSPRFPGLNFPPGQERSSVLVIQAPRGSESASEHVLPPTWLPAEEWPHLGSWG